MVAVGTGYSPKLPLSKGSFCFHPFFPFFKFILLVYSTSADSESIPLKVLTANANATINGITVYYLILGNRQE
jgi:hypothetical protein